MNQDEPTLEQLIRQLIIRFRRSPNKFNKRLRALLKQLKDRIRDDDTAQIYVPRDLIQIFLFYRVRDIRFAIVNYTNNVRLVLHTIKQYIEQIFQIPENIRQIKTNSIIEDQQELFTLFQYLVRSRERIQTIFISDQGISRFQEDQVKYTNDKMNRISAILLQFAGYYNTKHNLTIHVEFVQQQSTTTQTQTYLQIRL